MLEVARTKAATERAVYLSKECGEDAALRAEVESMLLADQQIGGFLEQPLAAFHDREERSGVDEFAQSLLGRKIGRYSIRSVIGLGGMGVVFEAVQESPHRVVALKVVRPGVTSRSTLRRFREETEILGRLQHPNICQIFEAGVFDDGRGGMPYFAMEYIRGARDLRAFIEESRLGTRQRLELLARVCEALNHAHLKGVTHRDLKPANILVDSAGEPKIIDFGVARATDLDVAATDGRTNIGQVVGTLMYMSPEQIDADPRDIDPRSDVYALGVVMYEVLTGELPYGESSSAQLQLMQAIKHDEPKRPSRTKQRLKGDVETILLKAMEKQRQRRYQSAGELAADIRRYVRGEPILARPPSLTYSLRKLIGAHRWEAAAAAGVLLTLVVGLVAASLVAVWAKRAADTEARARVRAEADLAARALATALAANATNDPATAMEVLETVSNQTRKWEWDHVRSRIDQSLAAIDIDELANSFSVSPDESLVAVGTRSGVRILRLPELDEQRLVPVGPVGSIVFDRSSRYVIACRESELSIIDTESDSIRPIGVTGLLEAVSFSPTADLLAVAVRPQVKGAFRLVLWNFAGLLASERDADETQYRVAELHEHVETVSQLQFSHDGQILASSGHDFTVRLWDVKRALDDGSKAGDNRISSACVGLLRGHTFVRVSPFVYGVAFSPDDSILASACIDGSIKLWDVQASLNAFRDGGEETDGVQIETLYGHDAGVFGVTFAPDGHLFSGSHDRTVRKWMIERDWPMLLHSGLSKHSEVFRSTGLMRGNLGDVLYVHFLTSSRTVLSGFTTMNGSGIRVFAATPVNDVPQLSGHGSSVQQAEIIPFEDRLFAVTCGDQYPIVWDVNHLEPVVRLRGHADHVERIAFDPHNAILATGDIAGVIMLWDFREPSAPRLLQRVAIAQPADEELKVSRRIRALRFSLDGKILLAGGADNILHRWRLGDQGTLLPDSEWPQDLAIQDLEFVNGGQHVVLALGEGTASPPIDGVLRVLAAGTGRPTGRDLPLPKAAAVDLALQPDGTVLAAACFDRKIRLFSVHPDGHVDYNSSLNGHAAPVISLEFQPNETANPASWRLVSGSEDLTVRFWELPSNSETLVVREHAGFVTDLTFTPDGSRFVTTSAGSHGTDNVVRLWRRTVTNDDRLIAAASTEAEDSLKPMLIQAPTLSRLMAAIAGDASIPAHLRERVRRLAVFSAGRDSFLERFANATGSESPFDAAIAAIGGRADPNQAAAEARAAIAATPGAEESLPLRRMLIELEFLCATQALKKDVGPSDPG